MEIEVLRKIDRKEFTDRELIFEGYLYSDSELEKTKSLKNRIVEYIKTVSGNEPSDYFYYTPECHIKYMESLGYVSIFSFNGFYEIYYYGTTEDEAFMNAIIDYEMGNGRDFELHHRDELNKEYQERFAEEPISNYHGPFFFAEHSLQGLRKFYKNEIPEVIVEAFERYLEEVERKSYKYDTSVNRFVKKKEKHK